MFVAERMASKKKTQSVQQQYRCVLETKVEKLSCGAPLHTMAQEKWDEVSRRCKTRREKELHQLITCKKTSMTKLKGSNNHVCS